MDWQKTIMEKISVGDYIKVVRILIPSGDPEIRNELAGKYVGNIYEVNEVMETNSGKEFRCIDSGIIFMEGEVERQ